MTTKEFVWCLDEHSYGVECTEDQIFIFDQIDEDEVVFVGRVATDLVYDVYINNMYAEDAYMLELIKAYVDTPIVSRRNAEPEVMVDDDGLYYLIAKLDGLRRKELFLTEDMNKKDIFLGAVRPEKEEHKTLFTKKDMERLERNYGINLLQFDLVRSDYMTEE